MHIKWLLAAFFLFPALLVHMRGRVRLSIFREIASQNTLLAPLNVLMYWSSALPNKPFIDSNAQDMLGLKTLQDNWSIIRDEAAAVIAAGCLNSQQAQQGDIAYQSFVKRGWRRYFLKWYSDSPHPSATVYCPKTLAILEQIPQIKAALFAYLPAGAHLTPHRDPYAGSLRYQLGLITPNSTECQIVVDGIPYTWRDGEAVLFDETFVHHAYNRTDIDRLVLFCDVERPLRSRLLTWCNRFFAKHVMSAASAPNSQGDATGWLNSLFFGIRGLSPIIRRMKQRHRSLFQLSKYTVIMLLIVGVFFFSF